MTEVANNALRKTNENKNENKSEFKREISLFGGISILGGVVIGSGIFYIGSYVLMRSGMSLGLSLLSWIIGGIVSLLGGICYAELGASDPSAGGSTVYLNKAYSPLVGFLNGFSSWLLAGPSSIAGIAIALPSALTSLIPMSNTTIKVIAISLIIGLTAVNYLGVKLGSIVQNLSMIAKLVPIGIILVLGLIYGDVNPDLSLTPVNGDTSFGSIIGMISFAVVASLWAYEGWTNLNTVAEEVKNPKRNLPLSIIIAIISITLIYTLFNYSIYRVVSISEIEALLADGNYYLGTYAAQKLMGNAGQLLVVIAMVTAMFGSLNGCILAFPRMYYAMSKEGHFFNSFKKLHPKYNVPYVPLIVQAILSIILVLASDLNQLTSLVVFTGMLFNTLSIFAVFIYRRKFPDSERPYKVFLYPFTVIITVLIFAGLLINTFIEDPATSLISLSVPAIGILFYTYFSYRNKVNEN
ncbi:MAG: amino acid permease [Tissierellaceae bacterium]|nr:amino acid permease [Tissierellaceae bacterium]